MSLDLPRFTLDDNPLFAASTRDAGVAYRMPLAQQGEGPPNAPSMQRITPFSGQPHRLEPVVPVVREEPCRGGTITVYVHGEWERDSFVYSLKG